jgi:acetate---CoA ligase (ADP-forming)
MRDIESLVRPGPVAIVGASDRSAWSRAMHWNLSEFGADPVWLINPNRKMVHGAPAVPSLDDVDGDVQLACVTVNANLVAESLDSVGRRGIRSAIVLASGFQEAGEEGRARSDEVRGIAESYEMTVLGPNTTGFINVADRYAPFGGVLKPAPRSGAVGIISQSGALAFQLVKLANARGVGLSTVLATGNELTAGVSDALAYLVDDDRTRAIAMFIEDIKDAETFRRAALSALEKGKPIVALKVGRTPAGRRSAMSHTGAVVGDDTVIDAAFRQLGVIRVRSLEELLTVAGTIAGNRTISGRRMGVLMASGGLCDIIADECDDLGLDLPGFAGPTTMALTELLPDYAQQNNPLDLTGIILADPSVADRALAVVVEDPNVDFVLYPSFTLLRGGDADVDAQRSALQQLAATIADTPVPVVLVHTLPENIAREKQDCLADCGLHVSVGLEATLTALSAAAQWDARRKKFLQSELDLATPSCGGRPHVTDAIATWDEVTARKHLEGHGVAVVPGQFVSSEVEAVDASQAVGLPVAVKVVSPAIAHKTEIGGVEVNIGTPADAGEAFKRVVAAGKQHANVVGALVTRMRTPQAELLVSVTTDPHWGPMLTIGLGGTAVEVLRDTTSALLPLGREDIRDLFGSLRSGQLIVGTRRDGTSLDVDQLISTIEGIIRAAESLGEDLHTVEINPLAVGRGFVEAIDVLIMASRPGTAAPPRPAT